MSTYIIGDLQGCYQELQQLLQLIQFNPNHDRLGFVGDLVNRGPDSLPILRFLKSLNNPLIVLGNHDLFLLMLGYGLVSRDTYEHTLHDVLTAPDKMELLEWLRFQPLIHIEPKISALLVHAGIPPQWNISQAMNYAQEVESTLRGPYFHNYLQHLFGNTPNLWSEHLTGQDRLRYISNALVRMRFCDNEGQLDLDTVSGNPANPNFRAWFDWRNSKQDQMDIYFGHWASLNGVCSSAHCFALDTGCAWGGSLTAIRVEDKKRFSVDAITKI